MCSSRSRRRGDGVAQATLVPEIKNPAPAFLAYQSTTTPDTYFVAKVVDGDTVDIFKGGKTVRLRLIGLDTPETVDPRKPVQCFGKIASDRAKELLTDTWVRIETDPSQGTLDKYGRTLAYIFFADGTSYEKYMIANGYGHEYTYDLPYKYQKEFKAAQVQAQTEKKGFWADDTCAGNTTKAAASSLKSVPSTIADAAFSSVYFGDAD